MLTVRSMSKESVVAEFIVSVDATLRKNFFIEADGAEEAKKAVGDAFKEGKVEFSMDDLVSNTVKCDAMTPLEAHILDGIAEEDCETLPE